MTLACLFAGTCDNLPDVIALVVKKKELDHRACVYPCAVKARGKNLGVVENKAVAGLDILRDIMKNIVLDGARFLSSTMSLELSRGSAGCCAMSSCGRS